jgi:Pilus formation protein N terminal region
MYRMLSKSLLCMGLVLASATLAKAEATKLAVPVDQSTMLQLQAPPGAIVIGNPSIADVSLQGLSLFIHARTYGQTNLIILDTSGKQVAAFDLVSVQAHDDIVAVYNGQAGSGGRLTYSCLDSCEAVVKVGDNFEYFKVTEEQIKKKSELATGSETSEAKAPEAPQ